MRMAMIATVILLAVVTPFSASAAESNCTLWSFNGFFQCLLGGVGLIFEWIIIPFLTLFVQITGSLFDFSVKTALDTSFIRGLAAIKDGWVIIRDVINMAFIFIILFIAIATILNISKYHMKQTLARLIIAAVLINFSFFVTGVIIDAGNVVAQGFYTPLVTQVKDAEGNTRLPSETLMGLLRVHTFWDTDSAMKNMQGLGLDAETPPDKKLSGTPYFMNALMRMILLAIIAYVFLVAAVLFIGRTIAFLFLLMLSPIGFIGDVIPGAGAAASKWWKTLIGQTLVAPIFLMFLYIIFLIAGALYPEIQKLSVGGVDANSPNITIFFNYALLIGLILMALKITKNVSGEVGAMTIKWAKIAGTVVAGAGLAAGVGVTAVAGRAVVGAAASRAAASGGLRTLATTQWLMLDTMLEHRVFSSAEPECSV
ncbi:MAG: hypothetical protein UX94_C0003G0031 [Parcubacteria group bacterium GW2011_GWA2_47_21]|nr:MAG: hypothetical protein UX94_C0003G0031 [Parcubacteria group bacterium GW2011_GWA2_47_21]